MRRALVLLGLLLSLSLGGVHQSRAQDGDCTDAYIRSFDVPARGAHPDWSAGAIQCREYFRIPVSTPSGEISIRGIGDANVAAGLPTGGIDAIASGVRRAARHLPALGNFDLDDTTILISSIPSGPTDVQPEFGYSDAWTLPGASRDGYVECHVTLFIQPDFTASEIAYAVAHELFHCVQEATLSDEQNATKSGSGLWWIEGSAELFAALAAGAQERWNRAPGFDAAVAEELPLYEMSYRMAVFFYWYNEQNGIDALIPFLHLMSEEGTGYAQKLAMHDVLSDREWLEFVEAYDDRRIVYPSGARLRFGQQLDGESWEIEDDVRFRREFRPFVIALGWANYACGVWGNTATEANFAIHEDGRTDWVSPWPGEINTRESATSGRRYRVAAILTDPGSVDVDFDLNVERRESCAACLTRAVIDRCLIGTWEMTGGGPMEFLRRYGAPISRDAMGRMVVTMRGDGTYSTRNVAMDYQVDPGDELGPVDTNGEIQASNGRWSAERGRLLACVDEGGDAMSTSVGRGGVFVTSIGSQAGTGGGAQYSCDDTTLATAPGEGMTFTFTRLTPRRP
ncbi:hypothetical protein DSM104635_03382 [Terricaulis silvestris]|uniref:Uncharacterized protein n=1 Tax=Terricaulis silvestris TaxID=2686094 RepID=A0A6I6MY06_9CAUL|nr:hypothetical protein DSM104635_03382 [Terricaulis silvestris]